MLRTGFSRAYGGFRTPENAPDSSARVGHPHFAPHVADRPRRRGTCRSGLRMGTNLTGRPGYIVLIHSRIAAREEASCRAISRLCSSNTNAV